MTPGRQFLRTPASPRNSVRELLQGIFTAELLAPSRCLWIVSPWVRDVPVLDNRTGAYQTLCPDFPHAEVALSRVLGDLLDRGTRVVIATRPEPGNRQVLDNLSELATHARRNALLVFREDADLHAKGIVGDRYSVIGSMNLTFNGLDHLTEMLQFETARESVERLRMAFFDQYGGTP